MRGIVDGRKTTRKLLDGAWTSSERLAWRSFAQNRAMTLLVAFPVCPSHFTERSCIASVRRGKRAEKEGPGGETRNDARTSNVKLEIMAWRIESRPSPLRVLRYENNISIRRASSSPSFSRSSADTLSTADDVGEREREREAGREKRFFLSNKNLKGTNSRRWKLPFCDGGKSSLASVSPSLSLSLLCLCLCLCLCLFEDSRER